MSIDKYTGVEGGGAVSQFARLIGADEVQDLTHDGFTTAAVLESFDKVAIKPDIITLTVGGNDLLQRETWNVDRNSLDDPDTDQTLRNLEQIFTRLCDFNCKVIVNTVYDPTDGDDNLLQQLGMSSPFREAHFRISRGIRWMAELCQFLLSDLHALFKGHGIASDDSWITMEIEPNHAGATAIAENWYRLFTLPENGMILTDLDNGWSFSLGVNDYQFEHENQGKSDNEWLTISLRVSNQDSFWQWTDPCLTFSDVKALAAWFNSIARGEVERVNISHLEPEVSFEVTDRSDDYAVVRVSLYDPVRRNGSETSQAFRQMWIRSERSYTVNPTPDGMIPTVYWDFTVTDQHLLSASKSLLEMLRCLPQRDGQTIED
jgi:lysophospholipase L1-like esterase